MDTLTIVNYAVNGSGVGHVQRLCAINRWLRRYAIFAGVRSQHVFLTTSEADTWLFAEGFAAFKLPSKSIVEPAGLSKPLYLALAKQWIWTAMSVLRPDLLVVDTFPNGSFDELAPALDLCGHKALVLRAVRPEISESPGFRAMVGLYDRVIVPGDEAAVPSSLPVEPIHTGPIMLDERFETVERAEARRRLGVAGDDFCLLVTGGGGGDPGVPAFFYAVEAALGHDPSLHLVFAAGPLARMAPHRGVRRTWWTEPGLGQVLTGVDGALSAAGFNSTHELLHAGVPTALYGQNKVADDQDARVQAFASRGAALRLATLDRANLENALAQLRDPATRRGLSEAALAAVPRNAARDAAAALLELCLPRSLVRQAVDTIDNALLGEVRSLGVELGDLIDVALTLQPARRPVDRAALELDGALALARAAATVGLSSPGLARLAILFSRKLCGPDCSATENGDALARLIAHATVSGQWSALGSLLSVVPVSRESSTARATDALLELIDTGAARGMMLSALAQAVMQAQGQEDSLSSPLLYSRVRARMGGAA
jgi:UDP-N-acetylglucosamine--N-acetylmuramyl-(pentapeptide) pyrophosphoryl-undecaprenol N-acetylglucosamine transferase